jgi:hypothetical protein
MLIESVRKGKGGTGSFYLGSGQILLLPLLLNDGVPRMGARVNQFPAMGTGTRSGLKGRKKQVPLPPPPLFPSHHHHLIEE